MSITVDEYFFPSFILLMHLSKGSMSLQCIGQKLSLNQFTNVQMKPAWVSTHALFTEPDGTFGHHLTFSDTTDAEL